MPRLNALNRYWRKHPTVHQLVASYLGFEAPDDDDLQLPEIDQVDDAVPIVPARVEWMNGMGAIPASDALRNAGTPEEALAAMERMFFGTLTEI